MNKFFRWFGLPFRIVLFMVLAVFYGLIAILLVAIGILPWLETADVSRDILHWVWNPKI